MKTSIKDFTIGDIVELFTKSFREDYIINSFNNETKTIELKKLNFNSSEDVLKDYILNNINFEISPNKTIKLKTARVFNEYSFYKNFQYISILIKFGSYYNIIIEMRKNKSENILRIFIRDGISKRLTKKINNEKDFYKFIDRWKEKINFLDKNQEYAKHLITTSSSTLYSIRSFFNIKKYINEIIDFNKRKDSDEYKYLLKEIKDFADNHISPGNFYEDKIIKIRSNGLGSFTIETFNSKCFFRYNEINEKLVIEDNFSEEKDLLRVFLPIFKKLGGIETVKANILKKRLLNE